MHDRGSTKHVMEMAKALKRNLDFISVFGGHHPTFVPEILNEPYIDVVVKGRAKGPSRISSTIFATRSRSPTLPT